MKRPEYCTSCVWSNCAEEDEVCDFCLDHPLDEETGKPVNWLERKENEE